MHDDSEEVGWQGVGGGGVRNRGRSRRQKSNEKTCKRDTGAHAPTQPGVGRFQIIVYKSSPMGERQETIMECSGTRNDTRVTRTENRVCAYERAMQSLVLVVAGEGGGS